MPRCPPCGIHRAITRRRHPMPIGRDRRSPQSSNSLGLRTTANQQVASGVFWSVRVGHSPRTRRQQRQDDGPWKGGKGLGKVERSVTGKCSAITSRASPSRLSVVSLAGRRETYIRSDLRRDARSAESVPRERDP
ncbi:hypothetical protein EVAR_77047_1 [Eumeta japonica]|uniref:Uncharacterized protein n=1 Tax=Eumeta variegata TaxID=151549 RepID=A0A4C2ACH4_EUMVA|nr:hypothetical protein EVAR_77047_1 [Eumeta japonica]